MIAISTRISPVSVLNRLISCRTKIVGTTAGGMMSPENTITLAAFDHPSWRRWATNPTIAESRTMNVTEMTVSNRLFLSAVTNMLSR